MKSFQFYKLNNTPDFSKPIVNNPQLTSSEGSARHPCTTIKMLNPNYSGGFALLEIIHERYESIYGYTTVKVDNEFRDIEFTSFLRPVTFNAFLHQEQGIVLFNTRKEFCKSAHMAIKKNPSLSSAFSIEYKRLDMDEVKKGIERYDRAWFSGMKGNVRSANINGHDIQTDSYWSQLNADGELTGIVFPFNHRNVDHKILLTRDSGVILTANYGDDNHLRLEVLQAVYTECLLSQWGATVSQK